MSVLFDRVKATNGDFYTYADVLSALERQKFSLGNVYLQLTPLCNLSCRMCYAKMTPAEVKKSGAHILLFEEWKVYLDSFYKMGVSDISLTGGECTIHPDFVRIYNYAYDLGFGISLLSNGTMINDEIFDLFMEKPPTCIAVTIYGSKERTYERLCNNKEAYSAAYRNVIKLIEAGFNVKVKYTLVQNNLNDLKETYEFFKKYDLQLRYQTHLLKFNKSDGDIISQMEVDENEKTEIEQQMYGTKIQEDLDKYDLMAVNTKDRSEMCRWTKYMPYKMGWSDDTVCFFGNTNDRSPGDRF